MAFRNWRLGMHIQQDSIAIVALLHERSHWALRRWWRIPLPPGLVRQGMVADVSALGSRLDINVLRELAGRLRLRVAAIVPDASALGAFFPWMTAADQGLAWRDEKRWLWATREAWGSDACADVGSLSQLAGQLQVPLRLCIDAGDEASRFDVWQVIHRRQPPLPADGDRYAIALGLALGGGRHDACR